MAAAAATTTEGASGGDSSRAHSAFHYSSASTPAVLYYYCCRYPPLRPLTRIGLGTGGHGGGRGGTKHGGWRRGRGRNRSPACPHAHAAPPASAAAAAASAAQTIHPRPAGHAVPGQQAPPRQAHTRTLSRIHVARGRAVRRLCRRIAWLGSSKYTLNLSRKPFLSSRNGWPALGLRDLFASGTGAVTTPTSSHWLPIPALMPISARYPSSRPLTPNADRLTSPSLTMPMSSAPRPQRDGRPGCPVSTMALPRTMLDPSDNVPVEGFLTMIGTAGTSTAGLPPSFVVGRMSV